MGGIALLKVVHVNNSATSFGPTKSCTSNLFLHIKQACTESQHCRQGSQADVHSAAAPALAPRHHPGMPVRRSRVEGVCQRPGEPKPALSGGLHCAMTGQ